MLKFHAIGDWTRDQVHVKRVPDARRIVPEVEELIESAWRIAIKRPGVKLFDGPMCRLERWSASASELQMDFSQTSYRTFWGTNLAHPELADRFGRDVMANPVGASPALHTADNFLLLGRRNDSVAYYPNRVHPFAGSVEPRDEGDVFGAVRRELAEELSLAADDVMEIRCTGIAEDPAVRQPELLFRVRTSRTRREIESQVDPNEHRASVAAEATPQGIAKLIVDPELTPVAVASLLLFANAVFGNECFDRLRGLLR